MKRFLIIASTLLLSAFLWTSCNKEQDYRSHSDSEDGRIYSLDLNFNVVNGVQTKANNSADIPITDWVKRLDLYTFYQKEPILNSHYTIIPEAGKDIKFHLEEKKNERVGVLVFANLDEDTAEYFIGKSLDELKDKKSTIGRLVLEAGNFNYDRVPMIGSNDYTFYQNGSVTIDLYRIMSRIDIGKINIEFDDSSLLGKEVYVKNVIIANVMNYFTPLQSNSLGHFYSTYLYFGSKTNYLEGAFGGLTQGFTYYNSMGYSNCDKTFQMNGPGKLNGDFRYEYNCNYKAPKGTLVADAPGLLGEMTTQHYDTSVGEGLIVSSGDTRGKHSFEVGKCFYTLFASPDWYEDIVCDEEGQDNALKIIVELSIDGKSWFYPIELTFLQPNTVYQVENITVKKLGSEYSNFYIKKYACDFTVTIQPWDVVDVSNVNVGVDPNTGEPVELYDE